VKERKSRNRRRTGAVRSPMQVIMMREVGLHELITKAAVDRFAPAATIEIMHTSARCVHEGVFQKAHWPKQGILRNGALQDQRSPKPARKKRIRLYARRHRHGQRSDPVYITGMVVKPTELIIRDKLTSRTQSRWPLRAMAKRIEYTFFVKKEGGRTI
jgi:hypothetical protein